LVLAQTAAESASWQTNFVASVPEQMILAEFSPIRQT
jgi:hypothetical protein